MTVEIIRETVVEVAEDGSEKMVVDQEGKVMVSVRRITIDDNGEWLKEENMPYEYVPFDDRPKDKCFSFWMYSNDGGDGQ